MYETTAVARLTGAVSLLVALAVWGLGSALAAGGTTASTWALGLAVMFPISALALGYAVGRSPPRTGSEYALGFVVAVAAASVTYLAALAVGFPLVAPLLEANPFELLAAGTGFGLLATALAVVDARYVRRPPTAARLEARYLDDPVSDD